MDMDEGNFDVENSRLQIKKLKEKVKSLVSEVDLSREIRSDEFSKTSKFQHEIKVNDVSSELELSDGDSDEFLDYSENEFTNETTWLLDRNGNCELGVETTKDIFNALYLEVDEFHSDISDLICELQLFKNSSPSSLSSSSSNKGSNRSSFIDSRTFTRSKKYASRPPLASIISNSSDDERMGKIQRRLTTTISSSSNATNKFEELNGSSNRSISDIYGDGNYEEGSEGLADIENSSRKKMRKTLPSSIIDRLQELKRSNCSYGSPKGTDKSKQFSLINGNVEDLDNWKAAEDCRKLKPSFDLNVKNALTPSYASDMFKSIPEYFSDDNESFFSLDEVSGFCDRLTLSTDPNTYSSIFREMEQNEICLYHGATPPEDTPLSRMTFGGKDIPMVQERKITEMATTGEPLLELDDDLNKTYEVLHESDRKANTTFEIKKRDSLPKSKIINTTYDAEKKQSLVDVILQSDIIKSLSPGYECKNCDNQSVKIKDGTRIGNNAGDKFNETYTHNELNNLHTEKYTTKVFDANFKKAPSAEKRNGKKDSDHSEEDCMSTTSDNSYRSVDSNNELKNIEELKSIAMQQSKKLSDLKFSTPKLENSKPNRNSDDWRNFSPIRKDVADGDSQGSSNASSRGPSPRASSLPSASDGVQKNRSFAVRQPPKVLQRELKLKPALIRPSQNFKKLVSNGRASLEPTALHKNEVRGVSSAPGIPVIKPSITPVTAVTSATNTKPVYRASGIPRPPSKLKQPQIRASEVFRK